MRLQVMLLGRCSYKRALDIQYEILGKRQRGDVGDILILVEHPPVITIGRNGKVSNIIVSEKTLNSKGIDIFETDRGGDVTYHGFGQIVGYPIINLRERRLGIKGFVGNLEEVFIRLLMDNYNIEGGRHPEHIGVWVGNKKITAIGIAVKKNVTMHGFAFNVNTHLEHFKFIIPCGIDDKGVTSIEELTKNKADFTEANKAVIEYFSKVFHYDLCVEFKMENL